MIVPPFLKPGDIVGILSTARKIDPEKIKPAIELFESWGFKVVLGKTIGASWNQFAGTDEERTADLQQMINNPEINAIICARGGYGTARIIDSIDFSLLKKKPKWICGYSDVTVLLSHLQKQGIMSIHSTMPIHRHDNSQDQQSFDTLKDCLSGSSLSYMTPPHVMNVTGKCRGQLTGGNLSILYHLMGSPSDVDYEGKILFIEDLDEYLYHIDRMMLTLFRAGKLAKIKGLIVGSMIKMRDNEIPFNMSAEEIVAQYANSLKIPVCYGFPVGHDKKNMSMIVGAEVEMEVGEKGCELKVY